MRAAKAQNSLSIRADQDLHSPLTESMDAT